MEKERIYANIYNMINNGFYLEKYIELTSNVILEENPDEDTMKFLEEKSTDIFNSILIACQLFNDEERIKQFVNIFSNGINVCYLPMVLPKFGITEKEASESLKHGFGVHFTTTRIASEIQKKGILIGFGKNGMLTEKETAIIERAAMEQKINNPNAEKELNYLFSGFGVGVSSYGSITNPFWMYHTPESLSFLFGNISKRNKEEAMRFVSRKISNLSEEHKTETFEVMSTIYDRLVGEEQEVCCILIDRDFLDYEIDYYYNTNPPTAVERRPYKNGLSSIYEDNCKINKDIKSEKLRFLKIPTIKKLELLKKEKLKEEKSVSRK